MKLFRLAVVALLWTLLAACQSSMSQSSQSSASVPMPSSSRSPSSSAPSMPAPSSPSTAQSGSRPSIPPPGSAGQQSQQSSRSGSQSNSPAASSQSSRASARNSQSGENIPIASFPGAGSRDQGAQNDGNDGSSGEIGESDSGLDSGSGVIPSAGSADHSLENNAQGPGQAAGTSVRLPAGSHGESGDQEPSNSPLSRPSGDYGLDSLPSGASGVSARSTGQSGTGSMTAAERAAVLDERLRRGYETFDGFILGERERAQNESNAAGSISIGGAAGAGDSGGAGGQRQPQTMEEASVVAASGAAGPSGANAGLQETFPPPEDIPSGRDDDVVARQLREAAMTEPDPELREALWEEYRNYTGIGDDQ